MKRADLTPAEVADLRSRAAWLGLTLDDYLHMMGIR